MVLEVVEHSLLHSQLVVELDNVQMQSLLCIIFLMDHPVQEQMEYQFVSTSLTVYLITSLGVSPVEHQNISVPLVFQHPEQQFKDRQTQYAA